MTVLIWFYMFETLVREGPTVLPRSHRVQRTGRSHSRFEWSAYKATPLWKCPLLALHFWCSWDGGQALKAENCYVTALLKHTCTPLWLQYGLVFANQASLLPEPSGAALTTAQVHGVRLCGPTRHVLWASVWATPSLTPRRHNQQSLHFSISPSTSLRCGRGSGKECCLDWADTKGTHLFKFVANNK